MTRIRRPFDEQAARIQRRAADPASSVVLRASAGSGKTRVLVDRIVRLLLAGTSPRSIVALTFTRKAAVEIRDRLLHRLSGYARLDDAQLARKLEGLLGRPPTDEERARAACAAEQLLDEASGLLIGTIHTFCQTLLSRFADEAQLDPRFTILEPVDDLWEEALAGLERELASSPPDAARLAELLGKPDQARRTLTGFLRHRLELDRWLVRLAGDGIDPAAGRSRHLPLLERELAAALLAGTPLAGTTDPSPEAVRKPLAEACRRYASQGLAAVEAAAPQPLDEGLQAEIDTFREAALAAAADLDAGKDLATVVAALRSALLTDKGRGTLRKLRRGPKPVSAACNDAHPDAAAPLLETLGLLDLIALWRDNRDLLRFGLLALDLYEELKRRDRCLDFHDLEMRAWRLLHRPDLGPWIQYRLDERIDHLLVDEFQDTNRNQWEILRPLAEEFLAGEGASENPRSVFFVGDVKQSIYRFRGARPEIFDGVADWLGKRPGTEDLSLPTNFRSLPRIIDAVATAFGAAPLKDLLPAGEAAAARQRYYRDEAPGEVLVLPPVPAGPQADREAAARVVAVLRHHVAHGEITDPDTDERRRPRWGDFLLLCRSRTRMAAYEEALRRAGIPFTPAGRGALAATREVQDILLLLRWLLLPVDETALAAILRSPLVRLGEADLQRLLAARRRGESLWEALRREADGTPRLADAVSLLGGWLKAVDEASPHDLLRRVYRESDALVRYGLALGEQARYNLLRLHDLALAHEQRPFPSLRGLADEIERAAQRGGEEEGALPEHEGGRVALMTIHGAKGLEAPIVVLVDDAAPIETRLDLVDLSAGEDLGPWLLRTGPGRGDTAAASPHRAAAEAQRRVQMREEANLLYVAMTRARDVLVAVGAERGNNEKKNDRRKDRPQDEQSYAAWLRQTCGEHEPPDWLATAAGDAEGTAPDLPRPAAGGEVVAWSPPPLRPRFTTTTPTALLAGDALDRDHDPTAAADPPVGPDGEAAAVAADADAAARRGRRIHLLLQMAAESGAAPPVDDPEGREAAAVAANPDLAWIFRPDDGEAACEVPVLGRLPGEPEQRLFGIVDRLIVTTSEVHVVDYKTNRIAAEDLEALAARYAPQLEAYRTVLARRFPGRRIRCWIVATAVAGPRGQGVAVEVGSGGENGTIS